MKSDSREDEDATSEHITIAPIHWQDDGQPLSQRFDDVYFSHADGLKESEYVFIDGNRLKERWQTYDSDSPFIIGETGFGTGLNFLLAWRYWLDIRFKNTHEHSTKNSANHNYLHFFSVEKYPLSRADLKKALSLWPELSTQAQKLIDAYPPQPTPGFHRLIFDNHKVVLTLFVGDAVDGFTQSLPVWSDNSLTNIKTVGFGTSRPSVDAWFLDGFAPAKNPEMWQDELFQALARHSGAETTFATFTVAGVVKRGLSACGFTIRKHKGFARKREMLVGEFTDIFLKKDNNTEPEEQRQKFINTHPARKENQRQKNTNSSWCLIRHRREAIRHCAVIGGGIAGCHAAFALAEKGLKVTLVEEQKTLAAGASGNPQGIVYAKLSPHKDVLSAYNLMALIYALHFYQSHSLFERAGDQCGALMLATDARSESHYRALAESYARDQNFVQWLDPQKSSETAGVTIAQSCLYLPKAGWLSPPTLCKTLCEHPNIRVIVDSKVNGLKKTQEGWALQVNDENTIYADAAVLANANDIMYFEQTRELPLKPIRGQITRLAAETLKQPLRTVVCGDGYVAPPSDGFFTLGASYNLKARTTHLSETEQLSNLAKLKQLSPDLALDDNALPVCGRAALRCTSPDYLPLVGPVPDTEKQKQRFAALRNNANAAIDAPGEFHENLFCLTGLGSRGLCYAPLAAELLASMITGDLLPVSQQMAQHLNPSRFIIRDLIKNKC